MYSAEGRGSGESGLGWEKIYILTGTSFRIHPVCTYSDSIFFKEEEKAGQPIPVGISAMGRSWTRAQPLPPCGSNKTGGK